LAIPKKTLEDLEFESVVDNIVSTAFLAMEKRKLNL
jgi:hypothetical protein